MITCYTHAFGIPTPGCDIKDACWVNLTAPSESEISDVSQSLDIPLDFLTDPLDLDERARIEIDDNCLLIVLHTPVRRTAGDSVPFATVPLGIVFKNGCLVTISVQPIDIMEFFLNRRVKNFAPDQHARFVIQIFNQTAILFLKYLTEINKKTNASEMELHRAMKNEELIKLLNLEKSLVYFTTSIKANEIIMARIQRADIIKMNEQEHELLEDAITENLQAIHMTRIYSNILSGMMDAFASIISNNLNVVMKFLTTVTIMLMIPNLVFSFFGQNVKLPFQEHEAGVIVTLVVAVLATVGGVWMVVKRRLF